MRKICWTHLLFAVLLGTASAAAAPAGTLDIYFIDVEGGQSTLIVTPEKQSFLIDAGFPDSGPRVVEALRAAGVKKIDYFLNTHFHGDHLGGVPAVAKLIPIRHFIDHDTLPEELQKDPAAKAIYDAYMAIRNKAPHIVPKPGEKLPLRGVDAVVVSSDRWTLTTPLAGAGGDNMACDHPAMAPRDTVENPRSTGVLLTFGKFRFLDVGDLSGPPLHKLACPKDMIGPTDVYLVAHHGGPDIADPATFIAFRPRVAVMNNGLKKGGAPETYQLLHQVAGLEDVWQIHYSEAAGPANFKPDRIANLDESTTYWIKLTAKSDGSFRVFNPRTKEWKDYGAH